MSTKNSSPDLRAGVVVGVVLAIVVAMSGLASLVNALSDPSDEITRPQFSEVANKASTGGAAGKAAAATSPQAVGQTAIKDATVDFGNGLVAETPSGWSHEFLEDIGLDNFVENDSAATVNITFYTSDSGAIASRDVLSAYINDFVLADFTDVELIGDGPDGQTPFDAPLGNGLLEDPLALNYDAFVTTQSQGNQPIAGIVIGATIGGELGIAIEFVDARDAFLADDFTDQLDLTSSIAEG